MSMVTLFLNGDKRPRRLILTGGFSRVGTVSNLFGDSNSRRCVLYQCWIVRCIFYNTIAFCDDRKGCVMWTKGVGGPATRE